MGSQVTWKDHHTVPGEEVPGWLTIVLLILGGFSVMAALWFVIPIDSYPALGSDWIRTLLQQEDGASSESFSGKPSEKLADALVADKKSAGSSETGTDTEASTANADDDTGYSSWASFETPEKQAVTPQSKEKSAPPWVDSSAKFGSLRSRSCADIFVVTFDHNSVTPVLADRQTEIDYLREWLATHPKAKVVLEGHSDALGPEEYNLLLSYRRAKTLATALAQAGLPSDRILVRAFGEQRPLTDRPATSVEQRRVSVRVDGTNECPEPR